MKEFYKENKEIIIKGALIIIVISIMLVMGGSGENIATGNAKIDNSKTMSSTVVQGDQKNTDVETVNAQNVSF